MVVRLILSWFGIGTPKPREDKELLAFARKVAKNMDGELVLPSDPDELKAELSKLKGTVDEVDGFLGCSKEEWLEVFGSKEWKEATKNKKDQQIMKCSQQKLLAKARAASFVDGAIFWLPFT